MGKTKAFSLSCFGVTTIAPLGINGNFPVVPHSLRSLGPTFLAFPIVLWYCLEAKHLPTMTTQSSSLRFADQAAESPYEFPGGYPKFAVTSDGACLCPSCCKNERELIGTTTGDDGWCVIGIDLNFEDDSLFCDHCSSKIESAVG